MATASTEKSQAPILDFESLLKTIENPKDKLLCACIATFADLGLAQQFISHLQQQPPIFNPQHIVGNAKVADLSGLSDEKLLARGLSQKEVTEYHEYVKHSRHV